jgi:hypothetical protein
MSKVDDVVLGRDPNPRIDEQNQMVEGKVKRIDAKGMYFTIKDWDNGKHEFGPAPWPMSRTEPDHSPGSMAGGAVVADHGSHDHGPHTHDDHDHHETKPVAGDRCLVVFLGGGVEAPWVIGWWPA